MRGANQARRSRTSRYRSVAALAVALAFTPAVAACGSSGNGATTVNVYYAPEEHFQQVVDQCNAKAGGRYNIVLNTLPRDADGQREQMVRRMAAGDTDIDILGLDVTWVAEFAEAGWITEWTGDNKTAAERDTIAGPLQTAKWKDKLYAATKNTNVQLLWYRDDLTPTPPTTWDEMTAAAKQLKDQGKPNQILMTGAQYEGLVVQYNTITASAGGNILSPDGTKAVLDAGAVKGLQVLHDFANSGLASPSLSNSFEGQVQLGFQAGNAAFELNWPYVYAAMNDPKKGNPEIAKHFKWTRYPGVNPGEPSKATIGGYDLAISSYSTHKPEAFDAALCLRSQESQKYSALCDGVPPTIDSIYQDTTDIAPCDPAKSQDRPNMAGAYPMKDTILDALKTAAVRPITPAYQNVSTVMATILSPPASIDPQATADRLRKELQDAIESKGVLP
ncbi:ABC transporter substrate-binding protein [Solihabitans fulvus]|uniref:ABC transporter substrate-binding protein n=1 Tax=Solihabitans fulvus TaxID=1892852 RepID=A0A5B2XMD5_9PSEU|nr:ABC transporter substrate-binding protein [Solihabitans fulvus]KAA2264061.1 ABC transporter substrate-binding protein [Solihabitans fulvus]